jgi:hypothetical protein
MSQRCLIASAAALLFSPDKHDFSIISLKIKKRFIFEREIVQFASKIESSLLTEH